MDKAVKSQELTAHHGALNEALSALLHIEKRLLNARSPDELGFIIANETLALVSYRQAVIFRMQPSGRYRLTTASGLVSVSEDSPFVVWIHHFVTTFSLTQGCQRLDFSTANPEFSDGWQEWFPDYLLVVPVKGSDGQAIALALYARDQPWEDHDLQWLDRLHLTYGYCLSALSHQQRHIGTRFRQALRGRAKWVCFALVLALFIPVRLSVLAPAEIVALNAIAIAAPQDGVIGAVYVQPNAPVKTGDSLFSLVDTTLSSRRDVAAKSLSIARAEARTAEQRSFDDLKSKGDMAAANGRVQEKEAELAAADGMLSRIVVKAERDGVAVFSDPNDWLGRPVQTGERVMQLANPQDTGVLVWLSASDALNLEAGAPVRLFLHTQPLSPLGAEVYQTSYQTVQSPEGVAAYRLFGRFDKDVSPQRIGLRGTARISGDWAMLGYYLLRRPIAAVREWTGL